MYPRTRPFLASVALSAALLVGCGTDKPIKTGTSTPPVATIPPGETPAGDVVIRLAYEGGFVPMGYSFTAQPTLTVLADGTAYTNGVHTEIFPGPLVRPMMVGRIEPSVLQKLLADAKTKKLNRTVVYKGDDRIADAANTVVTVMIDGVTYTHSAYALNLGDDQAQDGDRTALAEFEKSLQAVVPTDSKAVTTAQYAVLAVDASRVGPVEPAQPSKAWPADAGVTLAGEKPCLLVDAATLAPVLADANQNTRFIENGVEYALFVRQAIPGNGC